jgi:hypothetical protein
MVAADEPPDPKPDQHSIQCEIDNVEHRHAHWMYLLPVGPAFRQALA